MEKIRKGDEVTVIAGKDKGKRGVVMNVASEEQKITVEGINMVKKHTKGNPMSGAAGGIIEQEKALDISNVALWNPITQKGDRVGFKILEDGQKVRFFKSNNEVVDV